MRVVHCLAITNTLQQNLQQEVVLDWPYLQLKVATHITLSNLQHSRFAAEAVFVSRESMSTHSGWWEAAWRL